LASDRPHQFSTLVNMTLTLDQVLPGQTVIIMDYHDDDLAAKLFELGVLPGQVVRMIASAPWGDPIALVVSETMLSMRRAEAANISVELCEPQNIIDRP